MSSEESVADLTPDRYDFGIKKRDIFVPGSKILISQKYFEIYTAVFTYLQSYKADDVDAYIALMKVCQNLQAL